MKKLTVFMLILVLLSTPMISYAETIVDGIVFTSYSDDELLHLLDLLQQEIVDRKIDKSAQLTSGVYVVGVDIPVGSYVITVDLAEDDYCELRITEKLENERVINNSLPNDKLMQTVLTEQSVYIDVIHAGDPEVHLSLAEGQSLKISRPVTLTIEAGIVFQ